MWALDDVRRTYLRCVEPDRSALRTYQLEAAWSAATEEKESSSDVDLLQKMTTLEEVRELVATEVEVRYLVSVVGCPCRSVIDGMSSRPWAAGYSSARDIGGELKAVELLANRITTHQKSR